MYGIIVKCGKQWGSEVEYIHYNMIFQQLNMLIICVLTLLDMFSFQITPRNNPY